MKKSKKFPYSNISSFEDFSREKEILDLKSKIFEMKLSAAYQESLKLISVLKLAVSFVKEYILSGFNKKSGKED